MLKNFKVFVALGGLRPLLQSAVQHAHGTSLWHPGLEDHPTVVNHRGYRRKKKKGYLFLDSDVFFAGFGCCLGSWVYAFLLLCVSCFFFFCFSAFLFVCFCAFLLLLFYLFFSSIMCFCCSTSCFFASLLPVFTASLFFSFLLLHFLLFVS